MTQGNTDRFVWAVFLFVMFIGVFPVPASAATPSAESRAKATKELFSVLREKNVSVEKVAGLIQEGFP